MGEILTSLAYAPPHVVSMVDRLLLGPDTFRITYRRDPVAFVHDCFSWPRGEKPTGYQCDILAAMPKYRRIAVRGPHGLGKSALASWIILWLALVWDNVADWKIGATAGSWFQLQHFLFPEVHKWAHRLQWRKIGREPFNENELMIQRLRLHTGEAYAFACDRPELIEGQHASCFAQVYDESKAIQDETFDATEGAFASPEVAEAYAFAISTPGEPSGRFYDIHSRKPGYQDWWTRHVTIDEAIRAGRIAPEWVEQRKAQWGEDSSIYQNRVLGDFAADTEGSVIPLAWIEAANQRWAEWDAAGRKGRVTHIGFDVGGGFAGGDRSTIAIIYDGTVIGDLIKINQAADPALATMELAGRVAQAAQHYGPRYVVGDAVGLGAGTVQRLRELGIETIGFQAGAGTSLTDASGLQGFANWRTAGWLTLRDALHPKEGLGLALPPDDDLIGELAAPRIKAISSLGKVTIEGKEEIRKRIGRSTDCADAVIHALVGPLLAREQQAPRREVVWRGAR